MADCDCWLCIENRALWVPDTCKYGALGDGCWNWERCVQIIDRRTLDGVIHDAFPTSAGQS